MTSFFVFVFSPSFCLYLWTGSTNTNLPEKYKEPRNNKIKKRIVNIRPVLLDSNTTTGWILLHTLSLFILTFSFFLFLFLQDAVGYYKEKVFFFLFPPQWRELLDTRQQRRRSWATGKARTLLLFYWGFPWEIVRRLVPHQATPKITLKKRNEKVSVKMCRVSKLRGGPKPCNQKEIS